MHDIGPADPVIRNLVDEMVVECPQRALGCAYSCQRLLLSTHVDESCAYGNVTCHECGTVLIRKDLAGHTHVDTSYSGEDVDTERKPISHESSASNEENASLAADSQHDIPHLREDVLVAENALLRHRISALEGMVHILQQEMCIVQRALGPWYRSEITDGSWEQDVRPGVQDEYGTSQIEAQNQTNGGTSQAVRINRSTSATLSSQSPDVSRIAPQGHPLEIDLASYFPSEEEADNEYSSHMHREPQAHPISAPSSSSNGMRSQEALSQAQSATTRAHAIRSYSGSYPQTSAFGPTAHSSNTPAFTSSLSYPGSAASLVPASISVPPLDPTTPLPGTLASLHSSLVSLAGALSALATTRAQEALYTGEELRSLRGGMHGLRMQLHDVMTTRMPSRESAATPINGGGGGPGAGAGEGVGIGVGLPPWMVYGPRLPGPTTYPHIPGSVTATKL
ncbi:uncharacterized protein FIBRA_02085 [Fibroporia radiculosa]|uniref:TRAF-type domain-containing protein n=1 Tax=Fibroporia radiculosa TaxID=599839 RepID=J4G1C4_9APHY|nr:uncharacterized protein FIBRA_02085 [Fibroporia radiculosa]CCM00058.1 predicted protein [Fibroporia radiculosa]